jgi:trehalose 6-phosphate phosphatase
MMKQNSLDNWALFLDFDGTLVEIAQRPDGIVVDPGLPGLLTRLSEMLDGAFAVVSGRPIAFLDERLAPFAGDMAGLHGTERRVGGVLHPCRPEEHPDLREAVARMHEIFDARPGVIIEDKGCSVALHWRLAPGEEAAARAFVAETGERLGSAYRIQYGKAVAELLPAASGKGVVIEHFLQQPPYRGRRPLFVGDDLTDETGFSTVNQLGGAAIRIGDGETVAAHRLPSPEALRECLARWSEAGGVRLEDIPPA